MKLPQEMFCFSKQHKKSLNKKHYFNKFLEFQMIGNLRKYIDKLKAWKYPGCHEVRYNENTT